jgi:ribosome-interacting GTPase 1
LPANLTPVYHAAEERFRQAKTKEEKIAALEEMLAVIPKHKGTDHLQADIKKRIAKLRDEGDEKGGAKSGDPFLIPREGAGQVVLMGFPNTGKSSLVGTLTRAKVTVADYPFSTALPVSGMMNYEDILIQLVDLPPVTAEEMPKGMAGTLRLADLVAITVDGSDDDCLEQWQGCLNHLNERRILEIPGENTGQHTKPPADFLVVITKYDAPGADERLELLKEMIPAGWIYTTVSVNDPDSLNRLRKLIFDRLEIIRVYSKIPGKDVDRSNPFVLKVGQTVLDMAAKVHRDFPDKLKSAKVWGSAKFPGQPVEKDFPLADGDVVELHV